MPRVDALPGGPGSRTGPRGADDATPSGSPAATDVSIYAVWSPTAQMRTPQLRFMTNR